MSFGGKDIVNVFWLLFSFERVCGFKIRDTFYVTVFLENLWTDWYWYALSLHFLITMHETDTAAEVYLESFQTYMIEIFCENS